VIDTIAENLDTSRIFVSITGGEPLVRKDLFEVVAHMTRVGLRSCIVTNGTLLDERAAARLVEAGMRTVTVSVDGLEREHDAVRGKGTFTKALRGLRAAKDAGMTTVEAVTCARPANLDGLPDLERLVRDAGADLWRLITIDRMGRGGEEDAKDLWLEPPEVRRVLDFVAARREAYAMDDGEGFDVRFSCGGFLGVGRERTVRPEGGQCYAGAAIASILCDGEVGACPSLPRAWAKQGSVREKRFSAIWRDGFRAYRDVELRRDGLCVDCSWFDTCLGGGLHERLVQPSEHCWLDRQGA
jgi:radical SAM protein with 4Fe4S-binding SPASM domain